MSPAFLTLFSHFYIVVQWLSPVQLFGTPWTAASHASLSFPIPLDLLKLMSIELMMPSSHLILCCPLLLLSSISPSIRVFRSGFQSIGASASASVLPMNIGDYSQGNLKFPLGLTLWSPCSPRDSQEFFFFVFFFFFFPVLQF